jgi:o-succinylbenzoate---CoA ligase
LNSSDNYLPDWLTRCAENRPQHLAVQCDQLEWSFSELDHQVTKLARQLATLGVQEGNRVALLACNSLLYVAFVHALTRLGAILVPLNLRLTPQELCWQLRDVHASRLVSDADNANLAHDIAQSLPQLPLATLSTISYKGESAISELPEKDVPLRTLIDLSAPQAIMYTSGTTGLPKGAIITYGMQWWNAIGSALNLGHNPDDRWLACLPLFHIGGLSILMRGVIYGITVIVHKKFDPMHINQAIFEDKITIISVVPVMLQRMLDTLNPNLNLIRRGEVHPRPPTPISPISPISPTYPATLRCILLGGGPAPLPLLETCQLSAIPVVQTYGLTESCSQAVTLSPADAMRKIGSAGRPLAPVQLRILHDNRPTSPGEPGEIFLKGPTITPGYADNPEATARAFQDGWFSTGDIGYLDYDGYLYVLDRRADLIISGGENIYPAEIESILQSHPAVEEAGVCGQSDPQWGQVPIAFVVLKSGTTITAQQLLSHAAQKLARYKQPRAIYFTKQLPHTSSGKLVRRELPNLPHTLHK